MERIMTVVSLAVSVAGFIAIFTSKEKKTRIVLLALVVSLIGLSTTGIIDNWQQRRHIDRTKEEIMKMLGSNHPMSFEQIYGNLNYVDYSTAAQAVDELVDENLVNHAKLSVTSESGKKYEVRVYNYSAFPIN